MNQSLPEIIKKVDDSQRDILHQYRGDDSFRIKQFFQALKRIFIFLKLGCKMCQFQMDTARQEMHSMELSHRLYPIDDCESKLEQWTQLDADMASYREVIEKASTQLQRLHHLLFLFQKFAKSRDSTEAFPFSMSQMIQEKEYMKQICECIKYIVREQHPLRGEDTDERQEDVLAQMILDMKWSDEDLDPTTCESCNLPIPRIRSSCLFCSNDPIGGIVIEPQVMDCMAPPIHGRRFGKEMASYIMKGYSLKNNMVCPQCTCQLLVDDQGQSLPCVECQLMNRPRFCSVCGCLILVDNNKHGKEATVCLPCQSANDLLYRLRTRRIGEYVLKDWFLHEHLSCLKCGGPIMSEALHGTRECVMCGEKIKN